MRTCRWKRWFASLMAVVGLSLAGFADSVARVDNSGLPKVDYSKTVELKSLDGFGRSIDTKSLEFKAMSLPEYSGKLKPLPLTEWQSTQSDFYPKSLELKDFEVKQALDSWLRPASSKDDSALSGKDADFYGKTMVYEEASSTEDAEVSTGSSLMGEDLKRRINRGGVEAAPITVGRGFGAVKINPTLREQPETTSQRK